jgi:NAD(P)-dependent dehydrogenase (short-subunit alcohol dehydrogenase family)
MIERPNCDEAEMKLKGRVAIVTGAGQGIGRAIAMALAKEGAVVAIADIDITRAQAVAQAIGRDGGQAAAIQADVANNMSAAKMIEETVARHGALDILVNNVGIISYMPLLELTEDEWAHLLHVNLTGTFLCSQHAAKAMLRSKRGVIINISSISAELPEPDCVHYGVSKAGVAYLTKTFALALGKENIRVVAVAPGTIRTPRNQERLSRPGVEERRLMMIPLNRIGDPKEIADAVVFLASDEARYITGSTLYVEGGVMLLR